MLTRSVDEVRNPAEMGAPAPLLGRGLSRLLYLSECWERTVTIRARRLAKAPQRWVPMMGLSPFAQGDVRGGSFLHTAPGAV